MLWKLNFIIICVSILIIEFEQKIEDKDTFAKAIAHQSRAASCHRDADLRNDSRWKGERHLQNNIKTKPE
jgi:hypothetical protein